MAFLDHRVFWPLRYSRIAQAPKAVGSQRFLRWGHDAKNWTKTQFPKENPFKKLSLQLNFEKTPKILKILRLFANFLVLRGSSGKVIYAHHALYAHHAKQRCDRNHRSHASQRRDKVHPAYPMHPGKFQKNAKNLWKCEGFSTFCVFCTPRNQLHPKKFPKNRTSARPWCIERGFLRCVRCCDPFFKILRFCDYRKHISGEMMFKSIIL